MNERIREPYYSLLYKASEGWNDHLFQVPPELLEKFAELIVKECADIINHRADTSADYLDSNKANDHARQVQRDCATTIKQHFGVE